MKRWIIPLLVMFIAMAVWPLTVPSEAGAAVSIAQRAANETASYLGNLTTGQVSCLTLENQVMVDNAKTRVTVGPLVSEDVNMVGPLAPCRAGTGVSGLTPNAVEGGTPSTEAHAEVDACDGTYNNTWNINGHTTSVWLITTWGALGCWTEQPAGTPVGLPGSSGPGFSVALFGPPKTENNPGLFATTAKIIFVVTFTVDIFGFGAQLSQNTYWYWINLYCDGQTETGCHVGFC
jgi:hypothetical protein